MIKKVDNLGYKGGNFAPFVEYPQHLSCLHNMSIDVGAKLRSVRVAFGLSQRALARRAGVTNGLISLIEQNRVSPSVSSLKKVLDGVPMTLVEFFTLDEASAPQMFFAADELKEIGNETVSRRLVAAERSGRQLSILHERYAPGASSGDELLAHRGEEGGMVLRGRIELTIGGATRVLGPGDAYYFTSQLPHRFRNAGRDACEIVSCVTPPRQ
jgi:transcriptional regulator with XRE-family HTH domain